MYSFTPQQVQDIVKCLMQFPAAQTYDTIKMMDHEIVKQNQQREENAKSLVDKQD